MIYQKINILIGENNSGKSFFLRNLFKYEPFNYLPNWGIQQINKKVSELKSLIQREISKHSILDINSVNKKISIIEEIEVLESNSSFINDFYNITVEISSLPLDRPQITANRSGRHLPDAEKNDLLNKIKEIAEVKKKEIESFISEQIHSNKFTKIYIPTLRGLRPLAENTDNYRIRTKKDYAIEEKDNFSIFTGLELYNQIKNQLLGNLQDRENIREFEKFLSKSFFQGKEIAIIPRGKDDVVTIKIGNEKEQPIFNLGEGIQSIIILTFPLFNYTENNLLLYIEEPELYMHPSLQRKLINVFSEQNAQVFITTHSNHLLDLSLDINNISIYTFIKHFASPDEKESEAKFIIRNVSNEDTNTLGLIGVKNSSVFLSNCTIWVEGITDRYYIRHYLKLYIENNKCKDYKEDIHYSFVEYSGNNIAHWSFLDSAKAPINVERLCSKLFLITDKDDSISKKERHKKLEAFLKERYYCLESKEIENLLSPSILIKILQSYKEDEFKDDFKQEDYKSQSLGSFIEKTILIKKKRKGSYSEESGTITDKLTFCNKAISYIEKYDDLSPEAKSLTEKIYNFIKLSNPDN